MVLHILISILALHPSSGFAVTLDNGTQPTQALATFAGGCFWCMEPPFDEIPGVIETIPGYSGGHVENPTYESVSAGKTGHFESIQIIYDPSKISYEKLLEVFWRNIDPTDAKGQFCDKGDQYRSAIFYHDERQKELAAQSKISIEQVKKFTDPVETALVAASDFFSAEDYHQDYYKKNPLSYKFYRLTCGRDRRLSDLWDPD